MTKLRATSIALFLTVAALALGACGDDEGSNDSANTGTDATQATTGTSETGTTEAGTTTRERTSKTETRERTGDDKGGSNSGSGSGSNGSSGGGKDSSPEKELTGKNVFSTSKTVCNSFLPTALAKDLEDGKKSAEDIASDYARGYPTAERKQAHDGCLAGLKAKG